MKKLLTLLFLCPVFLFSQLPQRDSRIEHIYEFVTVQENVITLWEISDSVIRISYSEYQEDDTSKPIVRSKSYVVAAKPEVFWDSSDVALIKYPSEPDDFILVYDYSEKEIICIVKGDPHTEGDIFYCIQTLIPLNKKNE